MTISCHNSIMAGSGDAINVTEHFIVGGCIMFVRTWRFITLILAALTMGTAYAHALELPAKMHYDATLWTTINQRQWFCGDRGRS